jgi:hypothetical protein
MGEYKTVDYVPEKNQSKNELDAQKMRVISKTVPVP